MLTSISSSNHSHGTEINNLSKEKFGNLLRESAIKWMKLISENNKTALNSYRTDQKYIRKNIWYPEDLLKACRDCKQPQIEDWIRKGNFHKLGFLPKKTFDYIKDQQDEFRIMHFIAKENVTASVALFAALNGISIIDCGVACQIARYGALYDVLGEQKFNLLFSGKRRMNLGFVVQDQLQPMRHFIVSCKNKDLGTLCNRPIKKGQFVYIGGVKDYISKYPYGYGGGFNVICSDDTPKNQKFIGLGLNPEGETEEEICKKMLEDYNKNEWPPIKDTDAEKKWEAMESSDQAIFMDDFKKKFPEVNQVNGFDSKSIDDFDVEYIYKSIHGKT